jgi:mannose-6-phosphate isomerase
VISELSNVIQPYAWGSRRALAELRGEREPSAAPEAELWMGAHPVAPSRLLSSDQALDAAVVAAPRALLGERVAATYQDKLPFLLKVLAAAAPLSLQAHPTLEQAHAGFADDEARGVALNAPHRKYRDANHKPELLCSLGEFWALCGFRPPARTLALLGELDLPELARVRHILATAPNAHGISQAFEAIMTVPADERARLVEATTLACRLKAPTSRAFADELRWVARLGEIYPADAGVVSALLLNLLRLAPGEAIFLPAGNLHAYLEGTGVEIMASSDNVLRGGLTPKHVDVPELMRVLDFTPLDAEPLRPVANGDEHVYLTPAKEFQLSFFDVAAPANVAVSGPEIWLVTSGQVELSAPGEASLTLGSGRSAFVSADSRELSLRGSGRIFRARVAQPG